MLAERRKMTRTRVVQPAKLIVPNSNTTHRCIVDNLTSNGACVTFDVTAIANVPDKFDLTFDCQTFWSCRVIWRKRKRGSVGVVWKSEP
jgi:hypothetical protein